MQPKTEEFLNLLLWSADRLARPTFRNLTDSYESWAYRNGLLRQAATLERQQLLERDDSSPEDRLHRLTAQWRLHVLGERDRGTVNGGWCSSTCPRDKTPSANGCDATCATKADRKSVV